MRVYGIFYSYRHGMHYQSIYPDAAGIVESILQHIDELKLPDTDCVPTAAQLDEMDDDSDLFIEFSDSSWCTIQVIPDAVIQEIKSLWDTGVKEARENMERTITIQKNQTEREKLLDEKFDEVHWSGADVLSKIQEMGLPTEDANLERAIDCVRGKLSDQMVESGWISLETLLRIYSPEITGIEEGVDEDEQTKNARSFYSE
ncbi:MAG: hypothetical protein EPO24_09320 [Bacteroidetes bacterium]|nr:MAG: hypothetical protein EPO24_09320 [Bacteroidota bacterium]